MRYEGAIYRPPSEAYSLLIQVTVGCSHNKCTFCSMYKDKQFKIRDFNEIEEDIINFNNKEMVEKVFLCDGDALVLPTEQLIRILELIKENFPNNTRVSSYATFQDIQRKSLEELKTLYNLGLTLIYLGAESGSDQVLHDINKGINTQEMISAAKKAKEAKMKLSIMIISGLGGQHLYHEHALASANLLNEIDPDYFGLLSLMVQEGTKLYDDVQDGVFKLISPEQSVDEIATIITNLNLTNCLFSSNHISNYLYLKGRLPQDKQRLLNEIEYYKNNTELLNTKNKRL